MRGEPYQFFLNTPWGDQAFKKSLVDFFSAGAGLPRGPKNQYAKNYTRFSSRFRFNGKEWDEETGNYYYGARYYDPKISVWLSVDPEAARDPHMTPYHFVYNNPLLFVDPNGLHGYKVDANGNYSLVDETGGADFDVLYNEDLSSMAATTFESGTFTTGVKQGSVRTRDAETGTELEEFYDYQEFQGNNSAQGEILYNFLKDNTEVEIVGVFASSKDGKDKLTYVGTSCDPETSYGIPLVQKAMNTGRFSDVHFEHSHPDGNKKGPSDYSDYPLTGGDIGTVKFIYEKHAPHKGINLRTSVYDKKRKKQIFYNQNGVIK